MHRLHLFDFISTPGQSLLPFGAVDLDILTFRESCLDLFSDTAERKRVVVVSCCEDEFLVEFSDTGMHIKIMCLWLVEKDNLLQNTGFYFGKSFQRKLLLIFRERETLFFDKTLKKTANNKHIFTKEKNKG